MSDEAQSKVTQKRRVGRSPAYPNMSLPKALEKTKVLHDQEGDYLAPISSATSAWGYSSKSSGARQTLATLKYYGLVDVIGEGDARKVKISDAARRILLDRREDKTKKNILLRKIALNPPVHKTIFNQYGSGLASDGSVIHFLVFEEGYNQTAAAELLAEFKETAKYVGLYDPSNGSDEGRGSIQDAVVGKRPTTIRIGDRIQWTSQGVDQFPNGAIVLGFSEDQNWIFTDQGTWGVPIGDASVMEPLQTITPPQMPASLATALANKPANEIESKPGMRTAVFPVEDGDVTLVFPENLSADGLEELGEYLNIFLKKEHKKKKAQS